MTLDKLHIYYVEPDLDKKQLTEDDVYISNER